jgi:hypothetical protein
MKNILIIACLAVAMFACGGSPPPADPSSPDAKAGAAGAKDSDGDGIPDDQDKCPNEKEDGQAPDPKDGCPAKK